MLLSDGARTWLGSEGAAAAHPALLRPDPAALLDQAEMFAFDLNGCLLYDC